jgi:hypothetical protein
MNPSAEPEAGLSAEQVPTFSASTSSAATRLQAYEDLESGACQALLESTDAGST